MNRVRIYSVPQSTRCTFGRQTNRQAVGVGLQVVAIVFVFQIMTAINRYDDCRITAEVALIAGRQLPKSTLHASPLPLEPVISPLMGRALCDFSRFLCGMHCVTSAVPCVWHALCDSSHSIDLV